MLKAGTSTGFKRATRSSRVRARPVQGIDVTDIGLPLTNREDTVETGPGLASPADYWALLKPRVIYSGFQLRVQERGALGAP